LVGADVDNLDNRVGLANGLFVSDEEGIPITGTSTSEGGNTGEGKEGPPTGLITKDSVGDKVGRLIANGGDTGDSGIGNIPTGLTISE
jgi:hypothetical protein